MYFLALVYTVYIYAGGLSVACVYMWRYILRGEYVEHSIANHVHISVALSA